MNGQAAVLDINQAFYRAMRDGDTAAMEEIWAQRSVVTCTHPSSPMVTGRDAVITSWRQIFDFSGPIPVAESNCQAIVTGQTALVVCEERVSRFLMIASNAFRIEEGVWKMINHQAAASPEPPR